MNSEFQAAIQDPKDYQRFLSENMLVQVKDKDVYSWLYDSTEGIQGGEIILFICVSLLIGIALKHIGLYIKVYHSRFYLFISGAIYPNSNGLWNSTWN